MKPEIGSAGNKPDDLSELLQFKRSLQKEYEKRSTELRTESEKFISEKIFLARRETEHRVHSLRQEQKKRYSELLEREKRRVLLEVRGELLLEIGTLFDQVSEKIERHISDLRKDRKKYKPVLQALVLEALDVLGEPAVVKVFTGEVPFVPSDSRIQAVEEEEGITFGGCILYDSRTRSLVIDNSLMTRWKRFQGVFIKEFSEKFNDVLQGFDRFTRELRIS